MPRPNVLFVLTDQQRWDTTGVHGNPLDLTPNFDRLARQGTDVHYAFTPQPVCAPARAALLTGQYATEAGVWRNGVPLPQGKDTLGSAFREAGYATGYIGKWHLGPGDEAGPVPEQYRGGFDYWLASNALEFTSDAYQTTLYDNAGRPVELPGYRVDALADAAIRFMDRHRQDPFLLFLSFIEPHFQNRRDDYPAPEGYAQRYAGRWLPPDLAALGGSAHAHTPGYYGMVRRLDEALGRMLDALRSLGLRENTIVVFTSDHGNHFKTRNDEYKRSPHEASIRVPLALDGGPFRGGGRVQALASLIDLFPTLLDAAGLPVPEAVQGRSFLPLLGGRPAPWRREIFLQVSEFEVGRALRTRRWKYSVVAPGIDGGGQPSAERYREKYLYDLLADPYELNNLIGQQSHRPVADALRGRLIENMLAAGEAAPLIEPAPVTGNNWQHSVYPEEIEE
jgi:arylsulfatase A-like enzyme